MHLQNNIQYFKNIELFHNIIFKISQPLNKLNLVE